jgi:hypothetical protein
MTHNGNLPFPLLFTCLPGTLKTTRHSINLGFNLMRLSAVPRVVVSRRVPIAAMSTTALCATNLTWIQASTVYRFCSHYPRLLRSRTQPPCYCFYNQHCSNCGSLVPIGSLTVGSCHGYGAPRRSSLAANRELTFLRPKQSPTTLQSNTLCAV